MTQRKYGFRAQLPDKRDKYLSAALPAVPLPERVDLRDQIPLPPFDQGQSGSCVWNAADALIVRVQAAMGLPIVPASRLYGYWFTRFLEGGLTDAGQDGGCVIRDAFKAANRYGACAETDWPFDLDKITARPPDELVVKAQTHRPLQYRKVYQSSPQIRRALAAGHPIIFGFTVFDSFEGEEIARTGQMRMPDVDHEENLGGHAVAAVGYDVKWTAPGASNPNGGGILVRNSWGTEWGESGHFWMPMQFITDPDYASDFWTLEKIV